MNGENLLLAIGNIKEQHIIEFAQVKPYKKRAHYKWIKYVSIAASFVIVISMALLFGTLQHKDPVRAMNTMTVNGRIYEIICNKEQADSYWEINCDILAQHRLSYPIDKSNIGNEIGTFSSNNGSKYNVYDYEPYNGQSVLVVRQGAQLQYALFCNLVDNNTIAFSDLLCLYGFNQATDISEVNIGSEKLSYSDMEVFYKELHHLKEMSSYVDTDNMEMVKITIKGDDSDVLTCNYYPDKNVLNCALTFYQISDVLSSLMSK